MLKIVRQLVGSKVNIDRIWHQKELNIATLTAGLMKCVKNGDVLDCVACYLKCDPMKVGAVQTAAVIGVLKRKGEQIK